jgi:stress-induced morphogen
MSSAVIRSHSARLTPALYTPATFVSTPVTARALGVARRTLVVLSRSSRASSSASSSFRTRRFASTHRMNSAVARFGADGGPLQQSMRAKLETRFAPSHLALLNESDGHSGPPGRESHFKVTVVSAVFEGMPLLARHRAVNACLAEELANGLHALSIVARSPAQWEADSTVAKSPPCLGGQ